MAAYIGTLPTNPGDLKVFRRSKMKIEILREYILFLSYFATSTFLTLSVQNILSDIFDGDFTRKQEAVTGDIL